MGHGQKVVVLWLWLAVLAQIWGLKRHRGWQLIAGVGDAEVEREMFVRVERNVRVPVIAVGRLLLQPCNLSVERLLVGLFGR